MWPPASRCHLPLLDFTIGGPCPAGADLAHFNQPISPLGWKGLCQADLRLFLGLAYWLFFTGRVLARVSILPKNIQVLAVCTLQIDHCMTFTRAI